MKVCKQLLASSRKIYIIRAAAAGVFTQEKCHSSRGSCELCLIVKLPNSLPELFIVFFQTWKANLLLIELVLWVVNSLYGCGGKQQDAFTVNVKGSLQQQDGRAFDCCNEAVDWTHLPLLRFYTTVVSQPQHRPVFCSTHVIGH